MTYASFIEICEKYAKERNKFLYPNDIKAQKPLYKMFKDYCNMQGLSEDEKGSVFEWLDSEVNNPNVMIDKLDPVYNERIVIFGTLKDKIHIQTEIKRGNEKQIISEIKPQITQILSYEPFCHEGGNHIIFKNVKTGEIFYCIEWHYATEANLIKKTCKELGLTQKELAEEMGIAENTISQWARGITPTPAWAVRMFKLLRLEKQFNIVKEIFIKKI